MDIQKLKVNVNSTGKIYCPQKPGWSSSIKCSDFDVWAVMGGEGTLDTPSGCYSVKTGDTFILRPNIQYIAQHNQSKPLIIIFAHYHYLDDQNHIFYPDEADLPAFHRYIENISFVDNLLERMNQSFLFFWAQGSRSAEKGREANLWLSAYLQELQRIDDHLMLSSGDSSRYAEVIDICKDILRNPEKDWYIQDLANGFLCSKDHFIRIFRRYKGITPNDFIIHARIEAAKNHLRLSNLTVEEIAYLTGYKTPSFFCRQFRKLTGVSPSQYRAKPIP
ncbi:MAG TPA: hypothetical protein DD727_03535 [Clostridiales bacterium]|nr:hypothetical protein [Clostridiales bacterium]